MNNRYTRLLLLVFTILATGELIAQGDTLEIRRNDNGKVMYGRFKPDNNREIKDAALFLKQINGGSNNDELRLTKEVTDELGVTHRRYRQYYNGVPVDGVEYLAHGKGGLIETVNGRFEKIAISSVQASLSEAQALSKALSSINAKKYKWEDPKMEQFIKRNTGNFGATYYPKGELVIAKDYKGDKSFKLAWKFTISSLLPDGENLVVVNAGTGEIMNQKSLIEDSNFPCTAQTRYSGTLTIIGDVFGGGQARLRENRGGVSIQTFNIQSGTNYAAAVDFTNTNSSFTNGSWPAFNQDQVALDAHWGQEMTLDYWSTTFSRNSINGAGMPVTGYVHYSNGWNNAQWDGNNNVMRYGDGDGATFRPLTALDVTAHEIGHGINEYTANTSAGSNGSTEADALNEGLSDIWGVCVKHFAAPNKQTWLIGDEIVFYPWTSLRNLQNPRSNTALEGQHPDTYQIAPWSFTGEAHTNSTVLSHWFYLLSHGDAGTNGLGNAFAVTGIGIDAAQRIVYRAETNYLHAGATYADARTATIYAAIDLNGGVLGSCQELSVENAWYAVGVGPVPNIIFNTGVLPASVSGLDVYAGSSAGTGGSGTVTVTPSQTTAVTAINSITLLPSFQAVVTGAGSFTANIVTCGSNGTLTNSVNKENAASASVLSTEASNPDVANTLSSAGIQVYPSISKGTVYIKGSQASITNADITIIDGSGRPVYRLHNGANTNITLDLNNLANGLYFVQIHGAAKTLVQKIIISK